MKRIENRMDGIGDHAFAFLSFKMIPNVFCFPFLPERKSGLDEEIKDRNQVYLTIYIAIPTKTRILTHRFASSFFFTDYGELGGSSTKNFNNDSSGRFEH